MDDLESVLLISFLWFKVFFYTNSIRKIWIPISQSICSRNITALWQRVDALCCQSIFIDIDIDWYSHAMPTSYLPHAISIIHLSITRNPHQIQFIKHSPPLDSRCPVSLWCRAQWHCVRVFGVCVCVCFVRCLCRLSGKLLSAKSLPNQW